MKETSLINITILFILTCIKWNVNGQKVGALNFDPMMECTIGKTMTLNEIQLQKAQLENTEQQGDFVGYELDILIRTSILSDADFNTIQLTCYETEDELLSNLESNTIDYGIGGIHIDYTKLEKGFFYSLPLYTGGLKIAIRVSDNKSIWDFFDPFHWSLWVVMFFTTVFVSIITWLFEDQFSSLSCFKKKGDHNQSQKGNNSINDHVIAQRNMASLHMQSEEISKEESHSSVSLQKHGRMQNYQNLLEMVWQSFSSLFFASSIRLQAFSARILFLGFWFVVIIVSATYVSNLTTLLSLTKKISSLSSYSDIVNSSDVRIFTFSTYIGTYINPSNYKGKQEDIFVTFPPTKEGLKQLIVQFLDNSGGNGSYHVLLIDTPIVQNVHSIYPCTTAVLHETLNNFNYGLIVKNQNVLQAINVLLYNFIDDPYWLNLIQTYLNETPIENSCYIKGSTINLYSLAGLWVLMAISIFVAIIINRVDACKKRINEKKKQQDIQDSQKGGKMNMNKVARPITIIKMEKELEIQSNASPSIKIEEVQSNAKKFDGNQFPGQNGNNPNISSNQNEIGMKLVSNSINMNDKCALNSKRDNNSGQINKDQFIEDHNEIWTDFLMVSDYIHIPSKDIHLQAQDEVQMQVNIVESVIKKRFNNVEENIIRIMKKSPIKIANKMADCEKLDMKRKKSYNN